LPAQNFEVNNIADTVLTKTRKQLYLPGAGSLSEQRSTLVVGGVRNENQS
jgi:hypothetical protein